MPETVPTCSFIRTVGGCHTGAMSPETASLVGAFGASTLTGVVAVGLMMFQRRIDRRADAERRATEQRDARRYAEAIAVGELASAVYELRWEAPQIATVEGAEKYDGPRRLAPLLARMVAAQTRIYAVSDDEHLIGLARGVVTVAGDLLGSAGREPFDPGEYETLRSILERTFRALRQHHRSLSVLPEIVGDPTNETSDDYEGEGDPVVV